MKTPLTIGSRVITNQVTVSPGAVYIVPKGSTGTIVEMYRNSIRVKLDDFGIYIWSDEISLEMI